MNPNTSFYLKKLKQLLGGTITGMTVCPDGEFFGLQVAMPNGKKLCITLLSDDEGNGPGSFDIEEIYAVQNGSEET